MKKFIVFAFGLFILGIYLCISSNWDNQSGALSISTLENHFDPDAYQVHTIMTSDWEWTEDVQTLKDMLFLEEWVAIDEPLQEPMLMKMILSEEYEISLYESYACVYYGYAFAWEDNTAYYEVPIYVSERIVTYLESKLNE